MRTKTIIKALNHAYVHGDIDLTTYRNNIEHTLQGMDWQHRLQFDNMTLA